MCNWVDCNNERLFRSVQKMVWGKIIFCINQCYLNASLATCEFVRRRVRKDLSDDMVIGNKALAKTAANGLAVIGSDLYNS